MRSSFQQITATLTLAVCCHSAVPFLWGQIGGDGTSVNIVITEGQGVINNVRLRTARTLAVRVENEKQQPLVGATVTFTLPMVGASGAFANGAKTLVVQTDANGTATAPGMRPNSVTGKLEIRVTASYQGRTASATITQFNMNVDSQTSQKSGNGKWIAILLAAGGAGAAGAILGTRGSSPASPSAPAPRPTISLTPGSGSVGPPQ